MGMTHSNKQLSTMATRSRPVLVLLLCLLLAVLATPAQSRERYSESEVAVALLYKVARFVRWPDGSFDNSDASLRLCTYAPEEYHSPLRALEKRSIGSHPIEVVQLSPGSAGEACHVVFFTDASQVRRGDQLRLLDGQPVLTVGNFREFSDQGGILSLSKNRKRVNIMINASASERAGLEFNSQLLELSTVFRNDTAAVKP
jgi:hypothetical protein